MENYQKAEVDYMAGMKYKEIAKKYGTTINTVKSWKSRYGWNRKKCASKTEKVCTQNKRCTPTLNEIDDGTRDTLENDELTPKQQMFCIYYSRTFNATQSYQMAYGCSYNVANAEGYKLLVKSCIKSEIERLKEIKRQIVIAGADDIVELQMRIAFSDIGNYLTFGQDAVCLNNSDETDTQLIQEIKQNREGVSIKLADKQKAIDWLSRYFLMHPDNKYKAEFDRMRVEDSESIDDENISNDFIDALKEQAKTVIPEASEIIETEDSVQI